MDRRDFLKASVVGAGLAAGMRSIDSVASAQTPAKKAVLSLGSQAGILPGRSFQEKIDYLLKVGGTSIEMDGGDYSDSRLSEIEKAIKGTPVKISAICAAGGPYIVPDEAERRPKIENCKRLMSAGAKMGSTGVIIVPAFNGAKGQLKGDEGRKVLIDVLKELGEHGAKVGCPVLLEPLNRGEAWFLRQVPDAASICRDVNSPGVALMGDFYHMHLEETSDMGAFISAGSYLRHVHLASRTRSRILPHQENSDYRDGFRGLKFIGYQYHMSLECGVRKDTDRATEIAKTFDMLRKQWEEATIPAIA